MEYKTAKRMEYLPFSGIRGSYGKGNKDAAGRERKSFIWRLDVRTLIHRKRSRMRSV
ncbi:MAG: hypothetical protein ACLUIY_14325 [Dorea longicatena]